MSSRKTSVCLRGWSMQLYSDTEFLTVWCLFKKEHGLINWSVKELLTLVTNETTRQNKWLSSRLEFMLPVC